MNAPRPDEWERPRAHTREHFPEPGVLFIVEIDSRRRFPVMGSTDYRIVQLPTFASYDSSFPAELYDCNGDPTGYTLEDVTRWALFHPPPPKLSVGPVSETPDCPWHPPGTCDPDDERHRRSLMSFLQAMFR